MGCLRNPVDCDDVGPRTHLHNGTYVAALPNLGGFFDSNDILPQPPRMPYVRDKAVDLFRTKNRLKGWSTADFQLAGVPDY
ncbi:MAG: hypothetical protein JSU63_18570 [Phycisphaerales bacterium]|nr:MAG: hypothetical protein JSU63_18570 [Phycisphaerales bacterium]